MLFRSRNPEPGQAGQRTWTDTDKMYRNVTEKFRWGGVADTKDIYLDETVRRMVTTHRSAVADLATALYFEGYDALNPADSTSVSDADRKFAADRFAKAETVLKLVDEKLPASVVPYSIQIGEQIARLYLMLGLQSENQELQQRGMRILESEILRYGK